MSTKLAGDEYPNLVHPFIEAAPTALTLIDGASNIIIANAQFERMFGYERHELSGVAFETIVPKRFDPGATIETARRGLFGLHKAGRPVQIEIGFSHVTMPDGDCILASVIDLTERRLAEEMFKANVELLARAAELRELNADLESFSYSISHDLRAPLRAIIGFTRAVEEDHADSLGAEGRRLLAVVHSEGVRMGDLIDDLLAFSRLGRQAMHPRDVDMTELVGEVIGEFRHTMTGTTPRIHMDDLPPVTGDRVLLRQVWTNLISNAVKYSATRPEPVIRISGQSHAAGVTFRIADNGVGFDMKYADKLFGVFQRMHGNEEFSGSGVGLAIAARIVQRHGGNITADAGVDRGATFSFTLPDLAA